MVWLAIRKSNMNAPSAQQITSNIDMLKILISRFGRRIPFPPQFGASTLGRYVRKRIQLGRNPEYAGIFEAEMK
jgi:hypothetical protein